MGPTSHLPSGPVRHTVKSLKTKLGYMLHRFSLVLSENVQWTETNGQETVSDQYTDDKPYSINDFLRFISTHLQYQPLCVIIEYYTHKDVHHTRQKLTIIWFQIFNRNKISRIFFKGNNNANITVTKPQVTWLPSPSSEAQASGWCWMRSTFCCSDTTERSLIHERCEHCSRSPDFF